MSLAGQSVVIIGGTSGIGLEVARQALEQGARVTVGSRTAAGLDRASAALPSVGTGMVDVSDEASVRAFLEPLTSIDHLVVTAGTTGNGAVLDNELSALRAIADQRLWGVAYLVRAAAAKVTGSITLTSGVIRERPRKGTAFVSAVLAAVEALAPALAVELAPTRVNCISSGPVATPLQGSGPEVAASLAKRGQLLPVGRVGSAEELAQVYLMAMTNGYLNGSVLHVDGGARYV